MPSAATTPNMMKAAPPKDGWAARRATTNASFGRRPSAIITSGRSRRRPSGYATPVRADETDVLGIGYIRKGIEDATDDRPERIGTQAALDVGGPDLAPDHSPESEKHARRFDENDRYDETHGQAGQELKARHSKAKRRHDPQPRLGAEP